MAGIERKIQGYLECDGTIVKISSLDDIRCFVAKYGKSINDMTETELDELTNKTGEMFSDDCEVRYLSNPLILKCGVQINNYKIKDGTIAISNQAFMNVTYLNSIYIPDSVLCIGSYAFNCNNGLSTIRISNNLIKIGDYAWGGCEKLSSFIFPPTVKIIGKNAFYKCALKEIILPSSVLKIGAHAFSDNVQLKNVTFEGVPSEISSGVFDNCNSLERISVPKGSRELFIKALFPIDEKIIIEQE